MTLFDTLLYIFIVVVVIQCLFHLFVFSKLPLLKPKSTKTIKPGVSVIICAKNEAEYLKSHLPFFVSQDYPTYEIILVNDGSTDSSLDIMEIYSDKYNNIRVVNVQKNEAFWGSKKYALTLGIKAAKYDYLLLTDADCKPLSRYWIKQMTSYFDEKKSIVLGYGAYEKIKYSLLNKLIRFETLLTAVQYFSYALIGLPYMGVGRNLAYRKEEFFNNNGFADHMDILSGDDDLFINKIGTAENVTINISPYSFTKSQPEITLKNWIIQKMRHISTSYKYQFKHKVMLSVFYSSQLLFWVLSIVLLTNQSNVPVVVSLFAFIIMIKYLVLGFSAKKLREKDLILLIPILELFLICFQLSIFMINLFSKQSRWK